MNYQRKVKFSAEEWVFHDRCFRDTQGWRGQNRRIKRRTNKKIRAKWRLYN